MPIPLKYSTANQVVVLGHFVDSTDGNTEETALTIANTDIKLWKSGATTLANKNSGGATHISNGIYYTTLDATDTNTYGPLIIFVHVSGALPVRLECVVMEPDAYDALYAASGTGHIEADVVQVSGDATAANNLELDYDGTGYNKANSTIGTCTTNTDMRGTDNALLASSAPTNFGDLAITATTGEVTVGTNNDKTGYSISGTKTTLDDLNDLSAAQVNAEVDTAITDSKLKDKIIRSNTAQAGSAGSITLDSGASSVDDFYDGQVIVLTGGTGAGQSRRIDTYTGSTKVATVSPNWGTVPDATTTFTLFAEGDVPGSSAPTASQVADAVWDEAMADHTSAGSFGQQCGADIDAILVDTNSLNDTKIPDTISLANINAEVDAALDTPIPVTPTADSINERIKAIDDKLPTGTISDFDESTDTVTVGTNNDKTGYSISGTKTTLDDLNDLSAAQAADAVWDEAKSGHVAAGSFGEEVQSHALSSEIAALNDLSAAEVNAEVVDAINTDTYGEPGQGAPPATASLVDKVNYLYKAWRNKSTRTSTTISIYDDAGTTVDTKATISDDGSTFTKGEYVTGP